MKAILFSCIAFLGLAQSSLVGADNSQTSETNPLQRIAAEEAEAKIACERMKQDPLWTKLSGKLRERTDVFYKLSSKEKELLLQNKSAIPNAYNSGQSLFSVKNIYDSKEGDARRRFDKVIFQTKPLRVLRACKDNLIPYVPLHANNEGYYKKYISEDLKFLETFDKNLTAALESLSSDVLKSPDKLDESLYKLGVLTEHRIGFLSFVYFPYHLLFSDGSEKLSRFVKYENLEKDIDKDIAKIKVALGQSSAREERVSNVKAGDTSSAKSCSEIAVGLIPKDRLGGNYDVAVSKDFQEVLVKPTNEIYAGVGKVLDSNKSVITVIQTEALQNKQYIFQLKHDGKTRWFGGNVANGNYVQFVGRYVDNSTTTLQQGMNPVKIPSRVYDVVCVSNK